MTKRAKRIRWGVVVAMAVVTMVAFGDWETSIVFLALCAAWVAGTFGGFLADEYFPPKQHSPRDWHAPPRIVRDPKRWW